MAKIILSGTDPPGYELVPLREGAEFTLYRGRQEGTQSPVLVVAMTAIGKDATDERKEHDRQLPQEEIQAEVKGIFGEIVNQPALCELLYKRTNG